MLDGVGGEVEIPRVGKAHHACFDWPVSYDESATQVLVLYPQHSVLQREWRSCEVRWYGRWVYQQVIALLVEVVFDQTHQIHIGTDETPLLCSWGLACVRLETGLCGSPTQDEERV